jgi:predicted nucleotide-binding protein
VYIHWRDEDGARWTENIDFSIEQLIELVSTIKKEIPFLLKGIKINPYEVTKLEIWKTEERARGKSDLWSWIPSNGVNVTNDFIIALPVHTRQIEIGKAHAVSSKGNEIVQSKNIFVVHGKDHAPMKELKTMLFEFGLNPIVLHEQPSGSRTIVEKLEKYSDVGFAFVILAPDDMGYESNLLLPRVQGRPRARQNVVLEFGYFMGLLGRDKVCCLHKGNIELPSDMHGIVYVPFENSVEEIRPRIMKELMEAGYEIRL